MHKYKIGEKVWAINFRTAEQLTVRAHEADKRYELASLPVKGMAGHILSGWEEKHVFPDKLGCLLHMYSDLSDHHDKIGRMITFAGAHFNNADKFEEALEKIYELIP